MDYKVKGVRFGGRPNKIWTEVVEIDCQIQQLNKEDFMVHSKLIKDIV